MILQTKIEISKAKNQIDYSSNLFLLGSCFVENIGEKFSYYKFKSAQNPTGILFSPIGIENIINRAVNSIEFTTNDAFQLNEQWHCFEAHSALSSSSQEGLIRNLNIGLEQTKTQLNNATHLFITLGTSWVYKHLESSKLVANCHKVPQKEFSKEIISVEEVYSSLKQILKWVKSVNTAVEVIFTVSPVRHIKDGFVENQRSKAHLLAAIGQLVSEQKGVHYFPSYEIMMDELRDYRFYQSDMIHPNNVAVNYIWEKFYNAWIQLESHNIMSKVDEIQKGLAHRAFNPESHQHKKFLENLQKKINSVQAAYPHISFS